MKSRLRYAVRAMRLTSKKWGYEMQDVPGGDGSYTMMPLWRPGTPRGGDLSGHDEYAMWDAAYVLGSLSSVGRQEFEAHLAGCPLCPSAIGELSGMPALLSQLDRDVLVAIDEANRGGVEPLPPDELLPTLLAKV